MAVVKGGDLFSDLDPRYLKLDQATPQTVSNGAPIFSAGISISAGILTLTDVNVVLGTTTGTQIGTAVTQKIGFFGITPIIQPLASADLLDSLQALGLIGTLTTSTPLDLGSGALGCGILTAGVSTVTTMSITATSNQIILDSTQTLNGKTYLQDSAGLADVTITFPAVTGTLACLAGTNTWTANQTISNSTTASLGLTSTGSGFDDYLLRNASGVFSILNNTDSIAAISVAGTGGITFNAGADNTYTLTDAENFVLGSTTGNKIGTATSQKLGFWNATPIIQPASANQAAVSLDVDVTGADTVDKAAINSNFTSIQTLLNQLRSDLVSGGIIKGSA